MKEQNTISFLTEDGNNVSLEILEQTTIAGNNYILVADSDDVEEPQAYIMKEVEASGDAGDKETVAYEFVEEEQELLSISKIFEELLEDTDLV